MSDWPPDCTFCHLPLKEFGAILISPPVLNGEGAPVPTIVFKEHVCSTCYGIIRRGEWLLLP